MQRKTGLARLRHERHCSARSVKTIRLNPIESRQDKLAHIILKYHIKREWTRSNKDKILRAKECFDESLCFRRSSRIATSPRSTTLRMSTPFPFYCSAPSRFLPPLPLWQFLPLFSLETCSQETQIYLYKFVGVGKVGKIHLIATNLSHIVGRMNGRKSRSMG